MAATCKLVCSRNFSIYLYLSVLRPLLTVLKTHKRSLSKSSSCPMFCIEEALCLLINNFRYSAEKSIPLRLPGQPLQSKLKYSLKAVGVWVLWGVWGTFLGVKTNRGIRGLEGVISGK